MIGNMRLEKEVREKDLVRKAMMRLLKDHSPEQRAEKSRIVREKLLADEDFLRARTVMSYVSLPSEVDTAEMNREAIKRGKRILVPCICGAEETIIAAELTSMDDLVRGSLGIYEPRDGRAKKVPLVEIDLVVVPALAFDARNMRLGRGKGYYDRFLSEKDISSARTIGLAYRFQIVETLPQDPHDRPVNRVLTD